MNIQERLDMLQERAVKTDVDSLATVDNGYMSRGTSDEVTEFTSWFMRYMKRFGVGQKISRNHWGDRKRKQLQDVLYDTVKKQSDGRTGLVKKPKQVYDDLQRDVRSKDHTKNDFGRVARTETAAIKAIYTLQTWEKAGVKYVTHKNNPGSTARKTVGRRDKAYNNRVFEIKHLLSKAGEKDRIPLHPNCMCRYEMNMRGIQ